MEEEHINPWVIDDKEKGTTGIYPNLRRNALRHQPLVEEAEAQTRRLVELKAKGLYHGRTKISVETIITNMCYYPSTFTRTVNARMKARYNELKKERSHGKKSIDGIIKR